MAAESYVVFGSTQLVGANDAPSAAADTLSVGSFDSITLAPGLRVTFLGAAEVQFDAPSAHGSALSDSFAYTISDGRGSSDTESVSANYTQDAIGLATLDGTNGFRVDGLGVGDYSRYSVSAAGDVNGDGIDDVIAGAPNAETADGFIAGASYVVFGTDAGFASNLDLAALDGSNGVRLDGAAA